MIWGIPEAPPSPLVAMPGATWRPGGAWKGPRDAQVMEMAFVPWVMVGGSNPMPHINPYDT